ncbi:MAG: methyltransferase domain-containing protein [Planctomycetota bacterium]
MMSASSFWSGQRRRVDEQMDAPNLDPQLHQAALSGLRRLNRTSGVSRAMFPHLVRLARLAPQQPLRILDVASGSGDLPIDWLVRARRRDIHFQITALDRSSTALDMALESARRAEVDLGIVHQDCIQDGLPSGFDVVTCSLFMHHLEDQEVVSLVHEMWRVCSRGLLICDLERSRLHTGLIAIAAQLLTRSPIVHADAIASARGAYSRSEFAALIERSLGFSVPVRRSLPCRMIASVDQPCQRDVTAEPWNSVVQPAIAGATP